MFIPATREEITAAGWDAPDVIIVSGDTYIDTPYNGTAMIARHLAGCGFRVGIIAQPDTGSGDDILRLGIPKLFWGVTAGSVDSMVANYTAAKKPRRQDDLTPGGKNDRRPDRALIVYSNLIKRYAKQSPPIVLGGIEASMRRVAHYDFWSDSIRRSVLFDAKADILVYGMGERAVLEIASRLREGKDLSDIPGTCVIARQKRDDCIELPSFEEVSGDRRSFEKMFRTFYVNNDPLTAQAMAQRHGDRWLVHNRPSQNLTVAELDRLYELPYERDAHPYYARMGVIRALDTARFSVTTHRGCFGECNFCAIALHQGRRIVSRSEDSILREIRNMTHHAAFKGTISDIGGPTANMYGSGCPASDKNGNCPGKRCCVPEVCDILIINHRRQIELLKRARMIKGVRNVFVASGIRHDLVFADTDGEAYLEEIVKHHVSGQLKVAPEHADDGVLRLMGKPGVESLGAFRQLFNDLNKRHRKKQFLTYYFIAAHPGCGMKEMVKLREYIQQELRITPEQVQIFTPVPSVYSTLMYYTGFDPVSGSEIFVERDNRRKEKQKRAVQSRLYD